MKFYNRKKELSVLTETFKLSQKICAQFIIITGRRRLGKSALIKEFVKTQKRYLYFFVTKKRSRVLLSEFSHIFQELSKSGGEYQDWDAFFAKLFSFAAATKTILIFDEFQNFQYVDKSVFSIVQKYWDEYQNKKNLFLIIAGSVVSLLEKIFYDKKEPLYKRATKKMHITELDPKIIFQILCEHTKQKILFRNLLDFLTLFGGIPYYYREIYNANLFSSSLKKMLITLILSSETAILKNEGRELLTQEFGSDHMTYMSVLESISARRNTFSEIMQKTGLSSGKLTEALRDLEKKFRFIEKRKSIFGLPRKQYVIKDKFLFVWFRYIYQNESFLSIGKSDVILEKIIKELPYLCGKTFEEFSLLYAVNMFHKKMIDFEITEFGEWWDQDGQIDIVLRNKKEKKVLFGECKLSEKSVTCEVIRKLKKTSHHVRETKDFHKQFAIFIAEKSSRRLKKLAQKEEVILTDESDFMKYLKR